MLRRFDPEQVETLWQCVEHERSRNGRQCPLCAKPMATIELSDPDGEKPFDVCAHCRLFWFSPSAYHVFSRSYQRAQAYAGSTDTRRILALAEMENITESASIRGSGKDAPDEWWKCVLIALGVPVEVDSDGVSVIPFVTWAFALICVFVALVTHGHIVSAAYNWGYIPSDPMRHGGLTFLTAAFLHLGAIHLIGNMYFLLTFGDDVEDTLGHWMYGLLLVAAALASGILTTALTADPQCPGVGASGVVSAIVVFYTLAFPMRKLAFGMFTALRGGIVSLPAFVYALLWGGIQVLGALAQSSASGVGTGYLAHVGGAAVGVVAWLIYRFAVRPER